MLKAGAYEKPNRVVDEFGGRINAEHVHCGYWRRYLKEVQGKLSLIALRAIENLRIV
jgi:hypothetical protein